MNHSISRAALLGALAASLVLAPRGAAQTAPPPVPSPEALDISRTAAVHAIDGELWGAGASYKVRFAEQGMEFTPAFGPQAPRNFPLTFGLLSIERGTTVAPLAAPAPPARPIADGLRVEYQRGAMTERYDVGIDAVEQSFVFATRPTGEGDLIVRGRLTTDLQVTEDGDGLRFTLPGIGAFTMGGVVGVDADGVRARGKVRYADGIVELSLPAGFVDRAALPFVLDPIIGSQTQISTSNGFDQEGPAVAYDASNDIFLVVWTRIVSATDHDIYAHFVSRAAQAAGVLLFVEQTTALATDPQVANCNTRDAFVVVYRGTDSSRGGDILGRTVDASNGVLGPVAVLAGGSDHQHFGCVAGNLNNGQVLCVWQADVGGPLPRRTLQSGSVLVNANLTLTPGVTHTIASGLSTNRPRISKSDRGTGRHAVVFERTPTGGTDTYPVLRVLDSSGVAITAERELVRTTADEDLPDVDGDGTNWTAVWQVDGSTANAFIQAATVSFDPVSGQLVQPASIATITAVALGPSHAPTVTVIKDSCLVGYLRGNTNPVAVAGSVDQFACTPCEAHGLPGSGFSSDGPPSLCCVQASGGIGEDALIAYDLRFTPPLHVYVRRWSTNDGIVTSLGGACGRGGINRATCARQANPNFTHRLLQALPNAPTVFVLSTSQGGLSCGPCNLVPDLTTALTLVTSTNSSGNVRLLVPIAPASPLIGLPLFTQWATVTPNAPACSAFLLDMSDALRIVIQS